MAYPPPQQNQPPYGQQPPPYQQPPYGQQPPPYQQPPYGQQPPPYGYQPQYPYQPPRNNNSGVIIALLMVVILVAGGVVTFVLLSNQGLCNPNDLAGSWYETGGLETLTFGTSSLNVVTRDVGSFFGSYSCSGNIINWTLSNGQFAPLEIVEITGSTMRLKNNFGQISIYRR